MPEIACAVIECIHRCDPANSGCIVHRTRLVDVRDAEAVCCGQIGVGQPGYCKACVVYGVSPLPCNERRPVGNRHLRLCGRAGRSLVQAVLARGGQLLIYFRQRSGSPCLRILAKNNRIEAIEDEPVSDRTALREASVFACRSNLLAGRGLCPQGCGRHQTDRAQRIVLDMRPRGVSLIHTSSFCAIF